MHLGDEQVLRLVDGELSAEDAGRAREHAAQCAECAERILLAERARSDVRTMLGSLDPLPRAEDPLAEDLIERARPAPSPRMGWAAGFVLAAILAGVVAYAIPGSPVRGWVLAVLGGRAEPRNAAPPAEAPVGPFEEARPDTGTPGIAVEPGAAMRVDIAAWQPSGYALIIVQEQERLTLQAMLGKVSFTSEPDRIVVDNRGSNGSFLVHVPQASPRVEIRVAGRQVFLKEGVRISTIADQRQGDVYRLSLVRP